MILDKDDTRAEIIEYYDNRGINIQIQGKLPRELAYFITTEWDKIHDSYHNLKVQKFIPCNCSECKNQPPPYFHDYKILLNLKSKGIQASQCGHSGEMVNINQLLGEVFKESNTTEAQKSETYIHINNDNRNVNIAGNVEESNINQGDNVQQFAALTPEQQAQMLQMFKNKK